MLRSALALTLLLAACSAPPTVPTLVAPAASSAPAPSSQGAAGSSALQSVPASDAPSSLLVSAPSPPPLPSSTVEDQALVEPTDGFLARVTLKPFGIRVAPDDSPVQPERFSGYHTGADAEYGDATGDVEVRAVAPGTVVVARTVAGYGGLTIIRHTIGDERVLVAYGHLRPRSMLRAKAVVERGQRIGVLGRGFTAETDRERTHLHLAIIAGENVDLRGYVADASELTKWRDPVAFLEGRVAR